MRISIPKPCHENWNEMNPVEQGAFCKMCSKTVIDFSEMSDAELIAYFENKEKEKICGRFNTVQLSPYEIKLDLKKVYTQNRFPKIFAAALFIAFTSIFSCKNTMGEPVAVHVVAHDNEDTATNIILHLDTLKPDTIQPQDIIMGGAVAIPVNQSVDTTAIKENIQQPMGICTIKMGKVAVDPSKNIAVKPKTPVHKKESPKMVGELMF